jgi:hypothetical protein
VLTARATDEQEKAHAAMRVQVESVADCRGVEMPRRFHLDRRKVEIVESNDQWHGADYRYFKVKGDDGNFYILRFDEPGSEWDLTMFQRPQVQITQVYREKWR